MPGMLSPSSSLGEKKKMVFRSPSPLFSLFFSLPAFEGLKQSDERDHLVH